MKDLSIWFLVWFGVFCLTEAGEQQIGWVTEKDPCNFGYYWKGMRLAKLSCQN